MMPVRLPNQSEEVITISSDTRLRMVESTDGQSQQPTAVISVDGRQFVRLAGGRPMTGHAPQAIEYGGDGAVGTRIVENLAYVI